jgi:serine/threonine protein kinase
MGRRSVNYVAIAQQYCRRGNVLNLLDGLGYARESVVHGIIRDALTGLEALHQQRIYHNDIKPSNILIGDKGGYLLSDFEIAYAIGGPDACTYDLHAAPESFSNPVFKPNELSDIFQVGLTAYRLLNDVSCLMQAYEERGPDEFGRLVQVGKLPDRKRFRPHVSRGLRQLIRKALDPIPTRRFISARAMRHALERIDPKFEWWYETPKCMLLDAPTCVYLLSMVNAGKSYELICERKSKTCGKVCRENAYCCSSPSKAEIVRKHQAAVDTLLARVRNSKK